MKRSQECREDAHGGYKPFRSGSHEWGSEHSTDEDEHGDLEYERGAWKCPDKYVLGILGVKFLAGILGIERGRGLRLTSLGKVDFTMSWTDVCLLRIPLRHVNPRISSPGPIRPYLTST